jgi:PII-like signaling protein
MTPVPTLPQRSKMLRIYIGQDDRWEGKPLYEQIVLKMREHHAAGATVHKGAMGYGATQRMHTTGRLGLSHDLPVMITVVESEGVIRELLPLIDSMVTEGLVVLSDVDVIKYKHAGAER